MRTCARFPQSAAIPSKTRDIVPFLPNSALKTNISNRNWNLLEIVVTPTKHAPASSSNRNKNTLLRVTWGSHSCLHYHNSFPPICARTHSLSDCGSEATALPLTAKPRSRRLVHLDSSITTPISNRNFWKLEIAVTCRKQSPAPKANRNFRSTNSAPVDRSSAAPLRDSIPPPQGEHACTNSTAAHSTQHF
jgi:hypothetical protein